jgi:putative spermidine/putrescine transport system ATP-binding protein
VAENVAFGLRMREVPRSDIERRVKAALAQVALTGLEERKPGQLSGGQQQRVALARALVVEPPVLLCDEPLGALDRKLRQQMQFELKELQKRLGVTLVFVTHDQEEALAMSDRIAVMNRGRVEQVGSPTEIYERPRTRFVADFIGEINILEEAGRARALRPEKIRLAPAAEARVAGVVETTNFLGGSTLLRVRSDEGRIFLVRETHAGERASREPGDAVGLTWNDQDAVALES